MSACYHEIRTAHSVTRVFFITRWRPPRPTLFPYTTLFRSSKRPCCRARWCPARRAGRSPARPRDRRRSEEHTSELQSLRHLVCRLLLEKKKTTSDVPDNCEQK